MGGLKIGGLCVALLEMGGMVRAVEGALIEWRAL